MVKQNTPWGKKKITVMEHKPESHICSFSLMTIGQNLTDGLINLANYADLSSRCGGKKSLKGSKELPTRGKGGWFPFAKRIWSGDECCCRLLKNAECLQFQLPSAGFEHW